MSSSNYHEIVLTGASASGKTTALSFLSQKLADRGIKVLQCPETATILLQSGLWDVPTKQDENPELYYELEKRILQLQLQMRDHYRGLARAFAPEKVVILYDRGEMDVQAYAGQEVFQKIIKEQGLSLPALRDHYDAVIHLVSVAVDYPQFYNNHNNPARWETIEQARATNQLILHAWTGTPHLWVADNQHQLEGKLERVLEAVLHTIGLPHPVEHERKFLLDQAPNLDHAPGVARIEIKQTYLLHGDTGIESRVRQRSQDGQHTFYHTRKEDLPGGGRAEYEAQINSSEYARLLSEADPDRQPLLKTRWCFVWNHTYYELDQIPMPDGDLWLLEVELLEAAHIPQIPEWLGAVREVTDDPAFRSGELARKIKPLA